MRGAKPFCQLIMTFTLLVLAASLINSRRTMNPSTASQTKTQDSFSLSYSFEIKPLSAKLQQIRMDKVVCIKSKGINPDGFGYCCGNNYDKINNTFLNQYKIIELEFEKIFVKSVRASCLKDQDPCDELILFMEQNLPSKDNIFPLVEEKVEEIRNLPGVNLITLDEAINNFKKNYATFMRARSLIASFLFDTVKDLKTFIKASGVAKDFDYENFDPIEVLDQIGVIDADQFNDSSFGLDKIDQIDEESPAPVEAKLPTIMFEKQVDQTLGFTQTTSEAQILSSTANAKKTGTRSHFRFRRRKSQNGLSSSQNQTEITSEPLDLEDKLKILELEVDKIAYPLISDKPKIKSERPNFNVGLLKEIEARDKVHALIGKSLVDESRLDKTKMPSEILNDIQNKKLIIDTKY